MLLYIDRHWMCYAQSTMKGQITAKQNVFPPQVTVNDISHCSRSKKFTEKMKLTESGRQKLGSRRPVSRCSMQSIILTNSRRREREPLIGLGSHQVGSLLSASIHHGKFCRNQRILTRWLCQHLHNEHFLLHVIQHKNIV